MMVALMLFGVIVQRARDANKPVLVAAFERKREALVDQSEN
jgi:hypothetical protein